MSTRTTLLTLACCILAAGTALAANGEQGDWEFGPYVGYGFLDNYGPLDPDDDIILGGRVGYFFTPAWSLEASYQRLTGAEVEPPASTGISGDEDLDIESLRLNLLWNLRPGHRLRWHLTAGIGSEKTEIADFDESDLGLNVGGGLRWLFTDTFALRGDARWVSTDVGGELDERQDNIEATVGVSWLLGGGPPPDTDGDGVPDRKDDCPDTPRGATVDMAGCPKDSDGDGVLDGLDACPDTPSGWPVDGKGCPTDKDGDGVMDGADSCPDTPGGATVDGKGCPKDSDGDGVLDGLDRCANTPKGATVDSKGCPKDSDSDGVVDGLDKCPGSKRGVEIDQNGCEVPKPEPEIFKGKMNLVLEGVTFETSSATLTAAAREVLMTVAMSLKDWPDLEIEVAGHTDNTGSASYNKDLSQRRAEAVRDFLVENGANPDSLTATGYGSDKPIADNGTREGRARNRRVELTRMDS